METPGVKWPASRPLLEPAPPSLPTHPSRNLVTNSRPLHTQRVKRAAARNAPCPHSTPGKEVGPEPHRRCARGWANLEQGVCVLQEPAHHHVAGLMVGHRHLLTGLQDPRLLLGTYKSSSWQEAEDKRTAERWAPRPHSALRACWGLVRASVRPGQTRSLSAPRTPLRPAGRLSLHARRYTAFCPAEAPPHRASGRCLWGPVCSQGA